MKVNLKKASVIQNQILEKIRNTKESYVVSLDPYDVADYIVNETRKKFKDSLIKKQELNEVYYNIRKYVAKANQECGVNDILADYHYTKNMADMYGNVDTNTYNRSFTSAVALLEANKSKDGHHSSVLFNIASIDKDEYEKNNNTFTLHMNELSDKLTELNYTNHVELSERDVDILRKYGVI